MLFSLEIPGNLVDPQSAIESIFYITYKSLRQFDWRDVLQSLPSPNRACSLSEFRVQWSRRACHRMIGLCVAIASASYRLIDPEIQRIGDKSAENEKKKEKFDKA